MKTYILQPEWVALPPHVRDKLRQMFRIGKSGPVEVENNRLVSDGSTPNDLKALNVGAMLSLLGKKSGIETDGLFERLLTLCIDEPKDEEDAPASPATGASLVTDTPPFCGYCDSKGRFHKKNCNRII